MTLRAKVIDRWRELEAQVAKPAPVNLGDAAALGGLLIGYTEQVIKLELGATSDVRQAQDARGVIQAVALQDVRSDSGRLAKVYVFFGA